MDSLYCSADYFHVDQRLLCFVCFKFVDVAHSFNSSDYSPKHCVLIV